MSGSAAYARGSVLDRLLEDGTDERGQSLRALQASVQRDLEALLNARRPWAVLPDRYAALRDSILGYGLPDFAAGAFNAPAAREMLRKEVELAIRRFEPRLTDVVVKLLDPLNSMTPVLRIRIAAVLHAEGADDEPMDFETTLDSTTADMTMRPVPHG